MLCKCFEHGLIVDSPDANVYKQNYTLQCESRGEPNNSSFISWKHYSEQGEFLRSFNCSEFLVLNSSYIRYMLNGVYLCDATNGISNVDGNAVHSSNLTVQFCGESNMSYPRSGGFRMFVIR